MASELDDNGLEKTRSFRLLARGAVVSHYRIIEKIGEGGMGIVYKAQDTRLERTVALKFLTPQLLCDAEAKTRFEHEAKAASALNHTNIATIYDIDEAEDRCFISMEYIEGKSVKQLVRGRTLARKELLDVVIQIGKGLSAAHKKEIIHRDIKSDNIMVNHEGTVKITDFGLAKLKGVTKLTKTGSTLGTLHYMSPEQAQGKEVDHRSDIFSFGVVMYEMLTGQLPFTGEHDAAILHSIISEPHKPLSRIKPDIPRGLERIVDKALRKEKDKRYASVDQLLTDLREFSVAYQETDAKPPRKKSSLMVVASVLVIGLLILLGYFTFNLEKVTPPGRKMPASAPGGPAAEEKKSLAVMYFENVAGGERADLIRASLTEGLIANLSSVPQLFVVPKKEILDFKDKELDPGKIVDKTGVKYILNGTVRVIGQAIGLSLQMLDVSSNTTMWSAKYTCSEEELFDIQDKVALDVFDTLGIALSEEQRGAFAQREGVNENAKKLIERGLYYYDNNLYQLALESFKQALQEDRSYFRTHYYLGQTYQAMERWKEAIEEYQLALPESGKFRRIKYSCQLLDHIPPEITVRRSRDDKVWCFWHDPKDKTMNWKCIRLPDGEVVFEEKVKGNNGHVIVLDEHLDCLFSSVSLSATQAHTKIYAINKRGSFLWEFGDSTHNFLNAYCQGDYVNAEDDTRDSTYLLDEDGLLAAKAGYGIGRYTYMMDSCLFSYDESERALRVVNLKEPSRVWDRKLESGEYYYSRISSIVNTADQTRYKVKAINRLELKDEWNFEVAPFEESNCARWKDLFLCFCADGNLYAFRTRKPFYRGRLAWKTYVGQPRRQIGTSRQGAFVGGMGLVDTLVVAAQSGDLCSIDIRDGKVVWRINIGERVTYDWISVTVRNHNLLTFSENEVAAFDISSGLLKWSHHIRRTIGPTWNLDGLMLAWESVNVLSGLKLEDGTAVFRYAAGHVQCTALDDRIFLVDQSETGIEFKELNPAAYESGGGLREDRILEEIGICYFHLKNLHKADSIFLYIINDLGVGSPDIYYYRYQIEKKKGDDFAALGLLENYYEWVRDLKSKEEEVRKVFLKDFGVQILNGRTTKRSQELNWLFDLDSLILITNGNPIFAYNLSSRRAYYRPGEPLLFLSSVNKSTGRSVSIITTTGLPMSKVLFTNRLVLANYDHHESRGKVEFSVKLFVLDTNDLVWERRLIEGPAATSRFKILQADNNLICAYFQNPFMSSREDSSAVDDSADFHFWLLNTETGFVQEEKQTRLPIEADAPSRVEAIRGSILIPFQDKVFRLDVENLEFKDPIEAGAVVTGVNSNEKTIFVGTMDRCYSAYDRKTNELLWQSKVPVPLEEGFQPAILYLRNETFMDYWDYKTLFCFDARENIPDGSRIRWRFNVDSVYPKATISRFSVLLVDEDKVYVKLDNCDEFSYIILDRQTGEFLKALKLPWMEPFQSEVLVSGNTLYCLTADGIFYKVGCF